MGGLKIKDSWVMAKEVDCRWWSLGLPIYIQDEEILRKLSEWGVKAVSRVKRRMWPGTDIADGTKKKKKKKGTVKSLPYSTKFETLRGMEHFRVIHDRQVKACAFSQVTLLETPQASDALNVTSRAITRESTRRRTAICAICDQDYVCETPAQMDEENSDGKESDLYEVDEEVENK